MNRPRRRLNDMLWCVCGHAAPAHHQGTGQCYGGGRYGRQYPCTCIQFRERDPEEITGDDDTDADARD